jgi:hypothetical protein
MHPADPINWRPWQLLVILSLLMSQNAPQGNLYSLDWPISPLRPFTPQSSAKSRVTVMR